MITDEKMKKVWEAVIEINKNYLNTHKHISPICFVIKDNYNLGTILLMWNNANAKIMLKQKLKKMILRQRLRGYILCMDCKITKTNLETNKMEDEVQDALIHTIFTPKDCITHVSTYDKDKNFTNDYEQKGVSDWNVWNYEERTEQEKQIEKNYFDFKQKNPEKYGGTF